MRGKIMIRTGLENQEPTVVFVTGKNKFGLWICEALNTENTYFSKDANLIEFDFITFKRLYYQHKIDRLPKVKENLEKLLEDYSPSV